MHSIPSHIRIFLPLLGALLLTGTTLHGQNVLTANPKAVQLKKVWEVRGDGISNEEFGYDVWGGVDLDGDDTADYGQLKLSEYRWYFYGGGKELSNEFIQMVDSIGWPSIGDYWGSGKQQFVFLGGYKKVVDQATRYYDIMLLYELTDSGISSEPIIKVDYGTKEPPIERFLREIAVHDVNNDGVDDVIAVLGGIRVGYRRDTGIDLFNQVWIYYGGPDFQLDEPDVIVKDSSQFGDGDNWRAWFADFDGDHQLDMAFAGDYENAGWNLRFYWGDNRSPRSWSERPPDRDVPLINGETGISSSVSFGFFQLDGDDGADIAGYTGGDTDGTSVFLSTRGDVRTRSFHADSADLFYKTGFSPPSVGYLNDSLRRYEMLSLGAPLRNGEYPSLILVSGSKYGPDYDYEAWFSTAKEDVDFSKLMAIRDVTGDGYDDFIAGDWQYNFRSGVAFVVAGGPTIPLDDTTLSVREYPIAGESGGLYLWPNPVVDELHIAWRGNLKHKPVRFVVYDMVGREVVAGEVDPGLGAALWQCNDVASGAYRVVAFDEEGTVIGSAEVVKQRR